MSSVVVRSRGVVEEGKSIRLYCDFSLDDTKEETIYSILWYWSPLSSKDNGANDQHDTQLFPRSDLRLWPKSGLTRHAMPTRPVQFYRYLSIEPDHLKKKVWLNQLVGIFTVNVSIFYIIPRRLMRIKEIIISRIILYIIQTITSS